MIVKVEKEEDTAKRSFRILMRLYEISQGSGHNRFNMSVIGDELGLDAMHLGKIATFLLENELIELSSGETFSISNTGIEELKEAIANPYKPTKHFLSLNAIFDFQSEHQN